MMRAWKFWVPLVIFALFCAFVAVQLARPKDDAVESEMIGKPVPEFALRAASAERPGLATADLIDGRPKLLNIFASWCVPCASEAPQLEALRRQGVTIAGVAIRDTPEDLAAFLKANGNPYARIGADDISQVQLGIGSAGVPESFVVDGRGIIRYQHIGVIREEDVPMLLEKLREAGA